jgi:hypothetical protein
MLQMYILIKFASRTFKTNEQLFPAINIRKAVLKATHGLAALYVYIY